jgi:orotate phosphoribosyltransferase
MNDAASKSLLDLILRVSFERRKVILASGRESDFYLDLRKTLMRPEGVALAGDLLLQKLLGQGAVDAVGGMAVGAVPLISGVLAAAYRANPKTSLLGFFVRKEAKKHGLGQQIEGPFAAGQRVVLLEDTTTTGGSTLEAFRVVRDQGGIVTRVLCIVDRGEGAEEAFAAEGLKLESLFSRKDLPL